MSLRLTLERDPFNPVCTLLIEELSRELDERYGEDGAGPFDPAAVTPPRGAFVVAWLDERPVGCGGFRPTDQPDTAEIKRMYVRSDVRGRRISRRILAELETLAQQAGYARFILETGTPQPEAIRLYERAGYVRIPNYGAYKDDPLTVCFEKRLESPGGGK